MTDAQIGSVKANWAIAVDSTTSSGKLIQVPFWGAIYNAPNSYMFVYDISISNSSAAPKEISLGKGLKINGIAKIYTRDGNGTPINPGLVKGMHISLYDNTGNDANLKGFELGTDDRNIVEYKDGLFTWSEMTVVDEMFANRSYSLRSNSPNDMWVNCLNGTNEGPASQEMCTLSYSGRVDFVITSDKKIKITTNSNSFEEEATGRNFPVALSDREKGFNLAITEYLNSPLDKALSTAIKNLADVVEVGLNWTMMQVNNLLTDTQYYVLGPNVEGAWTKMRNIGIVLMVFGLIVIAFANAIQFDINNYGLNRMIPRLILAIILAYGSWVIVLFFFDMTAAIQGQAAGILGGQNGLDVLGQIKFTTPTSADIYGKIGAIILLVLLMFGVLIAGLVLLFSLVVRIVVLTFLLAIAPIAFLMYVLPFTNTLYKQWWSNFWKWMFMGPVAMVIIALGTVLATGVSPEFASGTTLNDQTITEGSGGGILLSLIIFAASLYFAATLPLSWGGKIMSSWQGVGKKIWGATGGAAAKYGKSLAWERTGLKGFFAARKANIDAMSRARGEHIRTKVAGSGKNWARSWAAGNSILNRTLAEAQASRAHEAHIQGLIKDNGLDALDESKLRALGERAEAAGNNELLEAVFMSRMKKGWTNGGFVDELDKDGNVIGRKVSKDQELFNRFAEHNHELVAAARVAGKGRDLLINSGNADWAMQATNDTLKDDIKSLGADETKIMVERATRALSTSEFTGLSSEQAAEKAKAIMKEEESNLEAAKNKGETLSKEQLERYLNAKALHFTKSLSDENVKRLYSQGGSVKLDMLRDNKDVLSVGTQKTLEKTDTDMREGKGGQPKEYTRIGPDDTGYED